MIEVEIRLFGVLRANYPGKKPGEPICISLPEGAAVEHLLRTLDLPSETVKIVFVNGVICKENYCLKDGDRVGIFPPIAGGSTSTDG